jgi:hypothetical protein
MPRFKKPNAPKFEPVFIADYRLGARSIAIPEAERAKMCEEDTARIVAERMSAELNRLKVLQNHLGLSGGLRGADLLMLLIAVANKYVPDFEVHVGAQPKPGVKKVGDRFKTVTEIDGIKILRKLPSTKEAIEMVAAERRPSISAQDLNTKYYACLREIDECKPAAELLRYWRAMCSNRPDLAQDAIFDSWFWTVERDHMGATVPHNVTPLKARKR